jgi:hypothetical protein
VATVELVSHNHFSVWVLILLPDVSANRLWCVVVTLHAAVKFEITRQKSFPGVSGQNVE